MHEAKMILFCPKCRQSTYNSIKSLRVNTLSCCHCGEKYYADALPKLAFKLSKEWHRLFKKHANAYFYSRIEFEGISSNTTPHQKFF
ncbi:hypothetical protein [Campylobacter hyointestinalis]|uniref:Uncharacterized protein n=2 Tax=Campylobacter hyointestinalis TaxID=198 RepID=A0A855N907_CAMHY|nr:hypothetical protein [Campylobacter hyointestinalis]PPB56303.1 hypothetical protein CDQ70_08960 [Campylobacter hyointestinalis subsp. hyointestinalis]PPB61252.1 hypothetical protein CDQ74_08870 [Campylobacter hyointestinalis subsp. hyointestinalis]PPB70379.1 hypothetical protein CDQ78_08985 [Campylobacter hyointestinalis subsp. hyointestinalis]